MRTARAAATLDNPICLALDLTDPAAIRALVEKTKQHVGVFKIGLTAFVSMGSSCVASLGTDRPVFVDLKLHDIPAQVAGAVEGIVASGARYTTVHGAGGRDMMRAAVDAAGDQMQVLAVTVLTSLDDAALARVGFSGAVSDAVTRIASEAVDAGVHGLVCSPLEVAGLRARFGLHADGGPLLVVPGIRATTAARDDQARTRSARATIDAGADMIVVGRPITAAPDPARAAQELRAEVKR